MGGGAVQAAWDRIAWWKDLLDLIVTEDRQEGDERKRGCTSYKKSQRACPQWLYLLKFPDHTRIVPSAGTWAFRGHFPIHHNLVLMLRRTLWAAVEYAGVCQLWSVVWALAVLTLTPFLAASGKPHSWRDGTIMILGEKKRQKWKVLVMELLDSAIQDGKFCDGCLD